MFQEDLGATDIQEANVDHSKHASIMDDLNIKIVFSAGEVSLPLSKLQALCSGEVIELPRVASTRVEMIANGQVIGTGELIEVDGRLAIEIISLGAGK